MSSTNVGIGGYLFCQVALLVMHYGFKIALPWWVLWFPSLITGGILAIVAIVLLIALILKLIFD